MNEYCAGVLKEMYDDCMSEFGAKKGQSLLIAMKSHTTNTNKRAFLNSARDCGSSKSAVMNSLNEEGYVKQIAPGKYILSARGILYVEFELSPLGIEYYIDWIDKEYLQLGDEPISDRNKVILLALFAARCFSEKTCATYSDARKENAFLEMLNESYEFLLSIDLVKKNCMGSGDSKSKSKMSSILGQIDKLPSSTGMKFVGKNSGYYVDVLSNGGIDRQSVTFIVKIIMGDKVASKHIDELEIFCKKQYLKYGYIFATGNESFGDTISEFQIQNGIEDVAI